MAVTLTVEDAADGTGGTATVGGAAGAAVTVYRAAFTGDPGALAWAAEGTRAGNGAVPLATLGHAVWMAAADTGGGVVTFSGPAYQPLTDGAEAVAYRVLDAVRTRVAAVGLAWLPLARIKVRWQARYQQNVDGAPPLCFVAPSGDEDRPDGLNNRDDVGYGVTVALVEATQGDMTARLARAALWREKVGRALRNQRLAAVPEVFICRDDPADLADPDGLVRNTVTSALFFRFYAREPRGLT